MPDRDPTVPCTVNKIKSKKCTRVSVIIRKLHTVGNIIL